MIKKPDKHSSPDQQDETITHISTPHIPGLDDYDLPPHIDIDYSKAKPNPYAARIKAARAKQSDKVQTSARAAKQNKEAVESHTVSLTKSDVKYLRKLAPNLSRAIHKLIDAIPR